MSKKYVTINTDDGKLVATLKDGLLKLSDGYCFCDVEKDDRKTMSVG